MLFYYAVFFIILILFFVSACNKGLRIFLLFISAIILCSIAAFRSENVDRDYANYKLMYDNTKPIKYYFSSLEELFNKDPAFTIVSSIVKYSFHDKVAFLFLFYAIMGVFLKLIAIKQMSSFWLLSILVYFSHYFLLHEMTQIRIGVASGFILLSLPLIKNRNLGKYLAYVLIAGLFHYSALIFLPLYLINPIKINVIQYSVFLFIPILFAFTNLSIHQVFTIFGTTNPLTQRYFVYIYLVSQGLIERTNLFNILILFNIALAFLFLMKWKILISKNEYAVIIIKIYIISIALFYLFYNVGAFASRFFEILNVVEIIVIPFFIYLFRPRKFAAIGVIICAFGLLSLCLLHVKLLAPYFK